MKGTFDSGSPAQIPLRLDAPAQRPFRKPNQVWGVGDMLDELDDLSARIGLAARETR